MTVKETSEYIPQKDVKKNIGNAHDLNVFLKMDFLEKAFLIYNVISSITLAYQKCLN